MGSNSLQLPVIYLSDETLKPGSTKWVEVRSDVRKALEEYGCFEVSYDRVSEKLKQSVLEAMEELFELPLEAKQRNVSPKPYTGYSSHNGLSESLGIQDAEVLEKVDEFVQLLRPDSHGNKNLSETIQKFTEKLAELDVMVRRMVMESFGIEKYFDEHLDSTNYRLRLMKYVAPPDVHDGANTNTNGNVDVTSVAKSASVIVNTDVSDVGANANGDANDGDDASVKSNAKVDPDVKASVDVDVSDGAGAKTNASVGISDKVEANGGEDTNVHNGKVECNGGEDAKVDTSNVGVGDKVEANGGDHDANGKVGDEVEANGGEDANVDNSKVGDKVEANGGEDAKVDTSNVGVGDKVEANGGDHDANGKVGDEVEANGGDVDNSKVGDKVNEVNEGGDVEKKLGLPSHTDKNLITVIYQYEIEGLEVQTKDEKWIRLKPSHNSFVVIAGDSLYALMNGRICRPFHRVRVTEKKKTRYSIALFSTPKADYIIEPPKELVDEKHPRVLKPFTYVDLMSFYHTEAGRKAPSTLHAYCAVSRA